MVNGLASGTALSYNNPRQTIREDFGTVRTDYILSERDTFSATYTIDDGNSSDSSGRPAVRIRMKHCAARWPAWKRRMSSRPKS